MGSRRSGTCRGWWSASLPVSRRKTPELRRRTGTREMRPTLLVVCEGKTEATLLSDLRAFWRIPTVRVEVMGEAGDPRHIVDCARRRQRETGADVGIVVFDRDEHHHWAGAIDRARQLGFGIAVSNPCFELWGILLHEDRTATLHRHDAQRRLRELHPGYDHARSPFLDVAVVVPRLEAAEDRARTLARRGESIGDPFGNPTTRFPEAVAALVRVRDAG